MGESLYQEYKRSHPERFRIGHRKIPIMDKQGRLEDHPCFGCIVEPDMEKHCLECRNVGIKDKGIKQTKLYF